MICFPQLLDQPHNCARVVDRGIGVSMQTIHDLSEPLIRHVLVENSGNFLKSIQNVAAIMRSYSREKGGVFLENLALYGGSHLIPEVMFLPWWQQLNLDMIFLVLCTFFILCWIISRFFSLFFSKISMARGLVF